MDRFIGNLNTLASLGTVLGQIFIVGIIILWLCARFGKTSVKKLSEDTLSKIGDRGLIFGFLVAAGGTAISLIYSDFIGFEPCKLCWIQRIFLYPQVIILGLALWKKTKNADAYCLALSIIGAAVGAFQYYGEMFNPAVLDACSAGGGVSCAIRYVMEFGYVTIPLMSLTAFLLIIASMLLAKSVTKN